MSKPETYEEALELLNQSNIFLTDIISEAFRKDYSNRDQDLKITGLNQDLKLWVDSMVNLEDIVFTSVFAKEQFCKLFNLKFSKDRLQTLTINDRKFKLTILPTPAGNGRSVSHFSAFFPLTNEEAYNKKQGKGFAKQYRKRLYSETLA